MASPTGNGNGKFGGRGFFGRGIAAAGRGGDAQDLHASPRRPGTGSASGDVGANSETAGNNGAKAASGHFVGFGRGTFKSSTATSAAPAQPASPETQSADSQVAGHERSGSPKEKTGLVARRKAPVVMRGEKGERIKVLANYIQLSFSPQKSIYEFHVSFDPPVDNLRARFALLYSAAEDVIGKVRIFNGATLFLPHKITDEVLEMVTKRKTDDATVKIAIKFVKQKSLSECEFLLNNMFRRIQSELKLLPFKRSCFDPTNTFKLPRHNLEIWPGYVTAIMEYEGGLFLQCDVSSRVLRTESVLEFIYGAIRKTGAGRYRDAVERELIGTSVITRYNNKTYRVDDIDWERTAKSTFTNSKGETIVLLDYYRTHYPDSTIKDENQPLLIHRAKPGKDSRKGNSQEKVESEIILLIPELCCPTGLTDQSRQDFKVMKDVGEYTRLTPTARVAALRKLLDRIYDSPGAKAIIDDWGIVLNRDITELDGRKLAEETIIMGKDKVKNHKFDWGRALTNNSVLNPVPLMNWVVVYYTRNEGIVNEFLAKYSQIAPRIIGKGGVPPKKVSLGDDRSTTYAQCLKEVIREEVQMVMIIFPSRRDDRYTAVKRICCIDHPVASQVVNIGTISKGNKLQGVTEKIALQMNAKLGGELWALNIPMKNCMVCGIDSYHDKINKGSSVGAFVASLNPACTRWASAAVFQKPGQELMHALSVRLSDALRLSFEANGTLPDKIFLFRDGVGDGQLSVVQGFELEQFKKAVDAFGNQGYTPKLTVIVVQKRINTRIMLPHGGPHRGPDNPMPGTVVDHTVTRRDWFDFFLVSQHVRQGTVSPTHYLVVHNENENFSPDQLQRLTYMMTHLYYNWPGPVRVPAPCQYAHRLASLIGLHLHSLPDQRLTNRLFYL